MNADESPDVHTSIFFDQDEVGGKPSFELLVHDGEPIVSGSYFVHPPLRAVNVAWDPHEPCRILVRANDGTHWYADDVPRHGSFNVSLQPSSEDLQG